VGIFFDVTKAYNVINHDILLEKLEHYEIRKQINGWLKSYLTLRAQYVEIFSKGNRNSMTRFHSRLRNIKVGIPQGSTLGPLLFLIYI
jgi:sarcosine oxidase/L-pipecolate oxidase